MDKQNDSIDKQNYQHIKMLIAEANKQIRTQVYKICKFRIIDVPIPDYFTKKGKCRMRCGLSNHCLCCYFNSALQCFKVLYPMVSYMFKNKFKLNKYATMLRKSLVQLWYKKQADCVFFKKELGTEFAEPKMMDMFACVSKILELIDNNPQTSSSTMFNKILSRLDDIEFIKSLIKDMISKSKLKDKHLKLYYTSVYLRTYECQTCKLFYWKLETNCAIQITKIISSSYKNNNVKINYLQDLLDEYFEEQSVELKCEECKKLSNYKIGIYPIIMPPTLIIELKMVCKNFFQGFGKTSYEKDNFSDSIKVTICENNAHKELEIKRSQNYQLVATGKHLGYSNLSGHYIGYSYHISDHKWYEYNDSYCEELPTYKNAFDNNTMVLFFVDGSLLASEKKWQDFDLKTDWNLDFLT